MSIDDTCMMYAVLRFHFHQLYEKKGIWKDNIMLKVFKGAVTLEEALLFKQFEISLIININSSINRLYGGVN